MMRPKGQIMASPRSLATDRGVVAGAVAGEVRPVMRQPQHRCLLSARRTRAHRSGRGVTGSNPWRRQSRSRPHVLNLLRGGTNGVVPTGQGVTGADRRIALQPRRVRDPQVKHVQPTGRVVTGPNPRSPSSHPSGARSTNRTSPPPNRPRSGDAMTTLQSRPSSFTRTCPPTL